MPTLEWPVPSELAKDAQENQRTLYALGLKDQNPLQIIRELTFDGVVPHITIEDIERLFSVIEKDFLRNPIHGVGVEVGSGPVVFGSILARREKVDQVYGVEICWPIIMELFPKVSQWIAGPAANKVTGVVGSFDDMQLPDASVDFVIDFFSLHHSLDIRVTLAEIGRILKPGGFLLMLDKARPDSYQQVDLDRLMDQPYGESYKRQFGIPSDTIITRRANGEREYRLKDWKATLSGVGFSRIDHWNLQQTSGGSLLVRGAKKIISLLPVRLQTALSPALPFGRRAHAFTLEPSNRVFIDALNPFRKETSLIVAYKA